MFRYYIYYIQAIMAKYKAWWEIKSNERQLNRCWEKILENKDSWDEDKLADVTAQALKCQASLDKSWQLYHEIYNF